MGKKKGQQRHVYLSINRGGLRLLIWEQDHLIGVTVGGRGRKSSFRIDRWAAKRILVLAAALVGWILRPTLS